MGIACVGVSCAISWVQVKDSTAIELNLNQNYCIRILEVKDSIEYSFILFLDGHSTNPFVMNNPNKMAKEKEKEMEMEKKNEWYKKLN